MSKTIFLDDRIKLSDELECTRGRLKPAGALFLEKKNGRRVFLGEMTIDTGQPNETLLGGSQIAAMKYIGKEFNDEGGLNPTPTLISKLDDYGRINLAAVSTKIKPYAPMEMFGVMFSARNDASLAKDKAFRHERGWNNTWNTGSSQHSHPDGEELLPLLHFPNMSEDNILSAYNNDYCYRSVEGQSSNYYAKRIYPEVYNRSIGGPGRLDDRYVHDDPILAGLDTETIIESRFKIEKFDFVDYFTAVKGNKHAKRISSVKILMGQRAEVVYRTGLQPVESFRNVIVCNIVNIVPLQMGSDDDFNFIFQIYM